MSRAIDETGYTQPFYKDLVAARGDITGYHFNPVTKWVVHSNGDVLINDDAKGW
jgi:sulfane dehydrogenase subunit SoxC